MVWMHAHSCTCVCVGGEVRLRGTLTVRWPFPPFACVCRCEVAIKANQIQHACVMHAHLVLLFAHIPYAEYTREVVATLLSSRIFLTTHYRYDLAVERGMKALKRVEHNDAKVAVQGGLGMADTEMFDLFAKTVPKIMMWLSRDSRECNEVMEAVVRVVTMTGLRTKAAVSESTYQRWGWRDGGSAASWIFRTDREHARALVVFAWPFPLPPVPV
jgi:hypothetical protein